MWMNEKTFNVSPRPRQTTSSYVPELAMDASLLCLDENSANVSGESSTGANTSDRDFEFVNFPPPLSSDDVIPLGEVPYLNENSDVRDFEEDLRAFRCAPLAKAQFEQMFDAEGRIVDEHGFRKTIFRGGTVPDIRPEVWSFLFGVYPCMSTVKERQAIIKQKRACYECLKERWQKLLLQYYPAFDLTQSDNCITDENPNYECFVNQSAGGGFSSMDGSAHDLTNDISKLNDMHYIEAKIYAQRLPCKIDYLVECLRYVSKDVPRTDRTHAYYCGDNNSHLLTLRNALLSFCLLHPEIGYVQGMNDLLARFFIVYNCEVLAFWSFKCYIENTQKDFLAEGMVHKISLLSSLLQRLDADLFHYLHVNSMSDMIFCHKWLLLCFQREFNIDEGLRLLEIISTHHIETNTMQGMKAVENCRKQRVDLDVNIECDFASNEYKFDLFICVAILTLYRDRIFRSSDGPAIFQTVAQLSENLHLDQVLCQAERLFYSYCHRSLLYSF